MHYIITFNRMYQKKKSDKSVYNGWKIKSTTIHPQIMKNKYDKEKTLF